MVLGPLEIHLEKDEPQFLSHTITENLISDGLYN